MLNNEHLVLTPIDLNRKSKKVTRHSNQVMYQIYNKD